MPAGPLADWIPTILSISISMEKSLRTFSMLSLDFSKRKASGSHHRERWGVLQAWAHITSPIQLYHTGARKPGTVQLITLKNTGTLSGGEIRTQLLSDRSVYCTVMSVGAVPRMLLVTRHVSLQHTEMVYNLSEIRILTQLHCAKCYDEVKWKVWEHR